MSQYLQSKLAGVRTKHSLVATGTGSTHVIVLFIAWIAGMMILDRLFELHLVFRAIFLLGGLALVGWILFKRSILPVVNAPDDETLALAVEREQPRFSTRLIAAIQFAKPRAVESGASMSLVRVTIKEAEDIATPLNFSEVVKTDRLLRNAGVALLVVLLASVTFVWGGDRTRDLLKRAFLSSTPLPTRTRVMDQTNITRAAQGDDINIIARAEGYVPATGRVDIRYLATGKRAGYNMTPAKDTPDIFSVPLVSVQESFEYRIRLYDGHGEWTKVQVPARPTITKISCVVTFPAYTKVPPMARPVENLQVLPGSRLKFAIETNKPLSLEGDSTGRKTVIHRFAGEKDSTDKVMEIDRAAPNKATAEIDVTEATTAFNINLVDADGLSNKDSAVYRIEILTDRAPTAHITWPDRKEILSTRNSVEEIAFVAEDDYMIGSVALKYRVDDGDVMTVPITTTLQRTAQDVIKWDLAKVAVPLDENGLPKKDKLEGSAIEYWIEVTDTNTARAAGSGRGSSDKYQIRIVSKEEKQAELMSRLGESMTQIQGVTESQENANRELGNTISGAETKPAQP